MYGGPGRRSIGHREVDGISYERRRRRYFALMAICLTLFVGAWAVVRHWSVPVAIAMCVVAAFLPPVATIVANRRGPDDRWWDEEP
ncbi:DUF3099 domain-containing protein [Streptomyces sp. ST2-7A]|uniref:DUF3099 domain-containing protein n=1 Tax=Streptomyces sp. ST2-7A TaxID=2907214 RepID=UPI001F2F7439|nr:DUF3099 domain-containing protein [Streptomyces sp. ST2-7A]MCE7080393.1 DUF3099 domain-containing protein [Streptomyces sp. ST2-7A]